MSEQWTPIDCCVGGTQYFRANAAHFLPQEPKEDLEAWKRRVYHATFSPYTTRIADQAAGLILRKPIQLVSKEEGGEVDPFWEEWAKNVDGHDTDLDEFSRRLVIGSILYGHAGVMVDYPATEPAPNLQVERELGLRPYLVRVDARQILGWRMESSLPMAPLGQLRINEYVTEPLGLFGDEVVRQIRVLEAGKWAVYRRSEGKDWEVYQEGTTSLSSIPFACVYAGKIGELISKPPLLPIANLNIAHAQRTADLVHALHVSALPMLVLKGFDDTDSEIGLSANTAILLPPEGDAMYVEPASSAFDAQRQMIQDLEQQMSNLGISTLFSQKMAAETAESKQISRSDSDSLLAIVSKDLERCLQNVIETTAAFLGIEAPEVMISRDFDLQVLDSAQVQQYMQLWMNDAITQETLLEMLKTGEVLPSLDVEMEVELTSAEKAQNIAMSQLPGMVAQQQGEEGQGESPERTETRAQVEAMLKKMVTPNLGEDDED